MTAQRDAWRKRQAQRRLNPEFQAKEAARKRAKRRLNPAFKERQPAQPRPAPHVPSYESESERNYRLRYIDGESTHNRELRLDRERRANNQERQERENARKQAARDERKVRHSAT